MAIGETLPDDQFAMARELAALPRFGLKQIFAHLPPSSITDLYGEFDAQLLDQGGKFANWLTRSAFQTSGPWIGKAFRPLTQERGEGYNVYGTPSDRYAKLRMDTYLAESAVAPGESFILDYKKKNRGLIRYLVGELRQFSPNIILGMGTFGPRAPQHRKLRRVIPFLMVGPVRPCLAEEETTAAEVHVTFRQAGESRSRLDFSSRRAA